MKGWNTPEQETKNRDENETLDIAHLFEDAFFLRGGGENGDDSQLIFFIFGNNPPKNFYKWCRQLSPTSLPTKKKKDDVDSFVI